MSATATTPPAPAEEYRLHTVNYQVAKSGKTFHVYESGRPGAPYALGLFDVRVPPGDDPDRVRDFLNQILMNHNAAIAAAPVGGGGGP